MTIPIFVGAQGPFGGSITFVSNISGIAGATGVLKNIAQWFLTIVIAVSVIFFVYAGFLYITSGGDENKVKTAKNYLLYGIIGIAIALLAAAITTVTQSLITTV